ncbi:MAG: hypothetical protein JNM90_05255 [Burkholderiales bacterium]|nr:hypothetical protein [Burkholderiales bacterium]
MNRFVRRVCAPLMFTLCGAALAGPGHDHGDDKPVAAPNIAPRFSAHSEVFELTGVVGAKRVTLYLDEYATNRPIGKASIDVEIKGPDGAARKFRAQAGEGDTFVVELPAPLAPGAHAVTAGVTAAVGGKEEADLLATTLEVAAATEPVAESAHRHGSGEWRAWLPWLGGGVALGVALWLALRLARTRRGPRVASAA